jgi:Putative zinc-finger
MNEKIAREKMVSYVAGTCSITEKREFEAHCLSCRECRMILAILLRVTYLPIAEEERKILDKLYPLGEMAAKMAVESISESEYMEMPA